MQGHLSRMARMTRSPQPPCNVYNVLELDNYYTMILYYFISHTIKNHDVHVIHMNHYNLISKL